MKKTFICLVFLVWFSCAAIVDITTQGNAISGGDYPGGAGFGNKLYAFDNDESSTTWVSSQGGSSIMGNAYIGQSNLPTKITRIRFKNPSIIGISSVKIQWSVNGTNWYDIQTSSVSSAGSYWNDLTLQSYTPSSYPHSVRILANSNLSEGFYMGYMEVEMYSDNSAPAVPGTPAGATETNFITFTWSAATDGDSGISGYDCQIGTTPGGSDIFNGRLGNVLNKTIAGNYGITYYCRVRAINGVDGLGNWSANSSGILYNYYDLNNTSFSTPGTVEITQAGTYHFTAAGIYTIDFNFPVGVQNPKITKIEMIGGGGSGSSITSIGNSGQPTLFKENGITLFTANGGQSGLPYVFGTGFYNGGNGGAGGSGGGGSGGCNNGGLILNPGTGGTGSAVNGFSGDMTRTGAAGGSGYTGSGGAGGSGNMNGGGVGGGGGGGGYLGDGNWLTGWNNGDSSDNYYSDGFVNSWFYGGKKGEGYGAGGGGTGTAGGGGSGYLVNSNSNLTISNTLPYTIQIGAGGASVPNNDWGTPSWLGGSGNRGYAKIIVSWLSVPEEMYFENSAGVSNNLNATEIVRLVKKSGNELIGHVSLNMQALGLDIYKDYSDIIIDKDTHNNPYVRVNSTGILGTIVNSNGDWIPVKLGPFTKKPLIKYSTNESTYTAVTDYTGAALAANIRNYNFDGQYVTFEVNHFSTYGTAILDSIEFTDSQIMGFLNLNKVITVNVKDTMGDGVENAPVTFSIQTGSGQLNGGPGPVMIRTNSEGVATVNYTFPNSSGINTVLADVDGTNDTVTLLVQSDLTLNELQSYQNWAAMQSPAISGLNDDPDGDGLTNLLEWNWGADSTSANIADTDLDGINDKWDAYPNNSGLKVFRSGINPTITDGQTFDGTAKNTLIVAPSNNLTLGTLVDTAYSKNAASDAIADNSKTILEINGLAKESIRDGNLAFASTSYTNNIYKALKPGQTYSVFFSYINRGNATDTYQATVNISQAANRWSAVSGGNSGLTNVAPWQKADFQVNAMPISANAFERVTLDVVIGLDTAEAVSYNAYNNAYILKTFNNEGIYGGADSFSNTFTLEAEGYDIRVINRSSVVKAPTQNGYSGPETDMVPGAKIIYTVVLYNNSYSTAASINIKDNVPNNCHLYYSDLPQVTGATSWNWKGLTDNTAGPGNSYPIGFEITIPSRGTVTASYTVTVD